MAIVRWEPVRELSSLQSEVNRLFNSVFDPAGVTAASGSAPAPRRWVPAMDLVEAGDHFVLQADLPGMTEEDVAVEVEEGTLTISGERKAQRDVQEGGFHRFERAHGTFSRSLTLPQGIDPDAVSASFDRGVLEVRIPKPVEAKPKRVSIAVGDGRPATIEGAQAEA